MTKLETASSFSDLLLSPELLRAVIDLGYSTPTEIQAQTIPLLLNHNDIIGHSATGTGKTAAFGIPAIEFVDQTIKKPQILILSPTRELTMQIATEMRKYAKYKQNISIATIYGGASMEGQIRELRKASIVIGTPGRIMDHMRRKTLKLDHIKMAVLDEADEMLSMGFVEDIQTILSKAPNDRQSILFSATLSDSVLKVAEQFLKDPQIVDVQTEQLNPVDIDQTYYSVPQAKKQEALSLLLKHTDTVKSVVFCNTKSMVDELATKLTQQGLHAAGLHGDMTQDMRSQIMQRFRTGSVSTLIATDVAARGIDVSDIDTVINYDFPQSFEYYVHRIGRTGRAGKHGVSQTLICNKKQLAALRSLMRYTGKPITEMKLPTSSDIMTRSVTNTAGEILSRLEKPTGEAAKMLVAQILEQSNADITIEQVALALAQRIMGSDKNYASIASESTNSRQSKPKSSAGNARISMTIVADAGTRNHITHGHLVAAVTERLHIPTDAITKIKIKKESSYISLCGDFSKPLRKLSKPIRINGVAVSLSTTKSFEKKPVSNSGFQQSFKKSSRKKRDMRSA